MSAERRTGDEAPHRRRWASSLAIVLTSAVALSAQAVFTPDDLDRAMKIVGRNISLLGSAIDARDYAAAKERVARAREQLSPTVGFWNKAKKEDARQMVRAATSRLDELDVALSADSVDAARVAQAKTAVDAACQACHAVYREQDPATKAFRAKPGL